MAIGCNLVIWEIPKMLWCFAGARVIMACRDMEKAQVAIKEVKDRSLNENVVCMKLDLADTKSIREFAQAFNEGEVSLRDAPRIPFNYQCRTFLWCFFFLLLGESKLNLLINNAGVMVCPYSKTVDGFEMQIGVNHMGKLGFWQNAV